METNLNLCWFSDDFHLKDLKASDIQDAQEGRRLSLTLVQCLVDSGQDPAEQTFVHRLRQSLHCKINLEEEDGLFCINHLCVC